MLRRSTTYQDVADHIGKRNWIFVFVIFDCDRIELVCLAYSRFRRRNVARCFIRLLCRVIEFPATQLASSNDVARWFSVTRWFGPTNGHGVGLNRVVAWLGGSNHGEEFRGREGIEKYRRCGMSRLSQQFLCQIGKEIVCSRREDITPFCASFSDPIEKTGNGPSSAMGTKSGGQV